MLARTIAGVCVVGGLLVGCVLFTGSTDGYSGIDAGAAITCTSATDCNAGQVCCATVQLATLTPSSSCQTGPCPGIQLCAKNSECAPDAGGIGCATQICTYDGASVTVMACGTEPFCAYR